MKYEVHFKDGLNIPPLKGVQTVDPDNSNISEHTIRIKDSDFAKVHMDELFKFKGIKRNEVKATN